MGTDRLGIIISKCLLSLVWQGHSNRPVSTGKPLLDRGQATLAVKSLVKTCRAAKVVQLVLGMQQGLALIRLLEKG
jgi:hypothetical protein